MVKGTQRKKSLILVLIAYSLGSVGLCAGTPDSGEDFSAQVQSYRAQTAKWENEKIVQGIKGATLPPNQNPALAVALLREVRVRKLSEAKVQLNGILTVLKEQTKRPEEKRFDPAYGLPYEVEATIRSLELAERGATTAHERAVALLRLIEEKVDKKEIFNAELKLLQEDADATVSEMLAVIDSSSKPAMKNVAIAVLGVSRSQDLEKEILARIGRYEADAFLFARLLVLLGRVGDKKAVDYLTGIIESKDKGNAAIAAASLKQIFKNTEDSGLRKWVEKILHHFEQK